MSALFNWKKSKFLYKKNFKEDIEIIQPPLQLPFLTSIKKDRLGNLSLTNRGKRIRTFHQVIRAIKKGLFRNDREKTFFIIFSKLDLNKTWNDLTCCCISTNQSDASKQCCIAVKSFSSYLLRIDISTVVVFGSH